MNRFHARRLATTGTALLLCTSLATLGLTMGNASAAPKTPGLTAHSITIGATVPLTGIASAGYNEIGKAADAVFKYVNAKGCLLYTSRCV